MKTGITFSIALAAVLGGCHFSETARPARTVVQIKPPLGLPPVPVPADNPVTAETIALGRKLFYDPRLSVDNSLACASCHNPALGFADGRRHSAGFRGKNGARNAPTIVNAAYASFQFWDGRAPSLEEQAGGPIANPIEMNQAHDACAAKLSADPAYRAQFQAAYGPGPVTIGKIKKAIASFERTVISGNSAFDRFQYGGDRTAMTPAALRGLGIFTDPVRGNCAACHTVEERFALFTDGKFHNIGAGVNGEGDLTDPGRYQQTKQDADRGAFKTPALRNVAQTAPYMHDGSLRTLQDVVDFYAGGGNSNANLDRLIKPIKLSAQDRADLVAFLESLTGEPPPNAGPPRTE